MRKLLEQSIEMNMNPQKCFGCEILLLNIQTLTSKLNTLG